MPNGLPVSANSFKGGSAIGCISCKHELLLNFKQIHHISSLFITFTVYKG